MKNTIKEFRDWQGLSQSDLALLCSINNETMNAIENNDHEPGLQLAFDMAKYLNVRIDELFINEEQYENG
ncbi:helix-turn-helix transcriptional regulator [Marinilactibacillus piezotolerans]|uniref:helix-turn-helix transcriptional regulator n=1 Tax=Marinilactibacillus piezotolerans TaxID=258723 RepID=UPI0009AFA055|nr:helix-turn-helix transcriptional regulator [Marinilactibacillus piezotolerans]